MEKLYPIRKIVSGNLQRVNDETYMTGLKNVFGIVINYNGEKLFYSILDDCFFRVMPSKEELKSNNGKYQNNIFVDWLVNKVFYGQSNKNYITKQEIIKNPRLLIGHYSDLDCGGLKFKTRVDYENKETIEDNIVNTELEYEDKLGRSLIYKEDFRSIG